MNHKPFYYTGEPCKYGHRSYRYVSTGNCVECLRNGRATRNNPASRELVSYAPRMVWANKRMTNQHWTMLDAYLQSCAEQFTQAIAHQLRDWCIHCGGFGYLQSADGIRRECPHCHTSGVTPE